MKKVEFSNHALFDREERLHAVCHEFGLQNVREHLYVVASSPVALAYRSVKVAYVSTV